MSLITNKQQELIDQAIKQYIKNYDSSVNRYLALRSEVFELSLKVEKDVTAGLEINEDDKIKLYTLRLEIDQQEEKLKLQFNSWKRRLKLRDTFVPKFSEDLEKELNALSQQLTKLSHDVHLINDKLKPAFTEMTSISKSHDVNLLSRRNKWYNKSNILRQLNSTDEKEFSLESLVFTREQVRSLFEDVDFDEVGNVNKYIDSQLHKGNRTFVGLGDDRYFFDITRLLNRNAKLSIHTTVEDLDRANADLLESIMQSIKEGVEAKEKWKKNSTVLDSIKVLLH